MFRGTYEHTIDDKGRVSVPARYRELLQAMNDARLVITNFQLDGHRCLDVYPHSTWVKLEEQLRGKPQFDPRVLKFVTYYVSSAQDCELDRHGRILLPPTLRDYAGLKREVVFASAIDKFRIWDRDVFQRVFQAAGEELSNNPALLEELGI